MKNIIIEDVKIGNGVGKVNVGLKFNAMKSMGEAKEFVEWMKENDLENMTVGKLPTYLDHWRGLREED